jgi:hypothetical protein
MTQLREGIMPRQKAEGKTKTPGRSKKAHVPPPQRNMTPPGSHDPAASREDGQFTDAGAPGNQRK